MRPPLPFCCVAVTCLLTSLAGAQRSTILARPEVRVTAKVDRAVTSTLRGTHPAVVDRAVIGSRLGSNTQLQHMILVLKASDAQEAALHTLLDAQQDKGSASFHKWLTPDDFSANFGVASADIAKVSAWLTDSGMSVESVSRSSRFISFSGSVGAVETAFSTEMHTISVDGEQHISNTADVSVPAALAPVIQGVKSLNNFFPKSSAHGARQVALKKNEAGGYDSVDPAYNNASGTHYVAPGDIATIYNATPLTSAGTTGKGVTISVLARSNIQLADVEAYRSLFGLPKNDPNIIVIGSDPGENPDDVEAFLDAELSGSLATDATVNFIVSSASLVGSGIDTAGLYAVDNNSGDIITLSYGGCETSNGASGTAFWNVLWEQAAAQGQTAFVSSGDSSAAGCNSSSATVATAYGVNALGSSAYNVAVGGSMFVDVGPAQYWSVTNSPNYTSALSYIPEAPWNQGRLTTTYLNSTDTAFQTGSGIVGDGGGISIYTARPSWQTGSGIPTTSDAINVYSGTGIAAGSPITGLHRLVPDLSFIAASGHDGTLFCYEGGCYQNGSGGLSSAGVVGGTSVAAPAMASVQALIDSANGGRQGNANIYYYALANQQYQASTTACQAPIGTLTNPAVPLPAPTCNFHDIIAGSNIVPTATTGTAGLGFSAGVGFDEASGLGSVNIANLAANWSSVRFNATATTFSLTPTTGTHGVTQLARIQVTPASGNGTPTGDVSIIATQQTAYGTPQVFTLSGGAVNGIVNSLPGGTYSVYAHYAGDTTFASSDSAPVTVTIGKEAASTNLFPYLVTAAGAVTYANSFSYGAGETYLDTEIYPNSGNGTASGSVTYTISQNGVALPGLTTKLDTYGTTYLIAGPPFSSFYLVPNYGTLSPGAYTITAAYSGDTSFTGSSSSTTITVTKATPSVSFTTSTAQINSAATATLNFSIATPASATPASGSVVFTDITSGTTLGTATLNNGAVSFSTTAITTSGANTITATYSGDLNYSAVSSSAVVVTVSSLAATTTTVVPNTTSVYVGTSVILTATVAPVPSTSALVYFYDSGRLLGSATVSTGSGLASLTVSSLTAGNHSITANYAGNTTQATSMGSLLLTVAKNVTAVDISGGETAAYGQTVSVNGYIVRTPSTTTVPAVPLTGVVNFYEGSASGTLLASATPAFGPGGGRYVATVNLTTLSVGSHSIVAVYPGDANYASSTSVNAPVTIAQATPTITVSPVSITYSAASTLLSASIAYPGATAPTGAVTFSVDGGTQVIGSCTAASGTSLCTALYPTGSLAGGTHTITVTEAADSNYLAASGTQTLTVNAGTNGTIVLTTTGFLSERTGGGYLLTVTVTNNGTGLAQAVVLSGVTVGAGAGTPLPQSLGSIQPGGSATVTVTIPSTAGSSGSAVVERISGSYSGGSFGGSLRAQLP